MTLVKQPDNAEVVREELKRVGGSDGTSSAYITFLLRISWNVDLDNPQTPYCSSNEYIVDTEEDPDEIDNNDGITVIDITRPESPTYCFAALWGLETEVEVPSLVPLSATQYIRAYYPALDPDQPQDDGAKQKERNVCRAIGFLAGVPMVTQDVLHETWPSVFQAAQDADDQDDEASDQDEASDGDAASNEDEASYEGVVSDQTSNVDVVSHGDGGSGGDEGVAGETVAIEETTDHEHGGLGADNETKGDEAADEKGNVRNDSHGRILSLFEISLKPAVLRAVETDDTSTIERLLLQTETASRVQAILRDSTPLPPSGLNLLQPIRADLSKWSYTAEQLVSIVSTCKSLESFNLSNNPNVTSATIESIMGVAPPSLQRLVVLNCPSLDNSELCVLMSTKPALFKNLNGLIAPITIQPWYRSQLPNTFSITTIYHLYRSVPHVTRASTMPVATPTRIVQCMIDYFAPIAESKFPQEVLDHPNMIYAVFSSSRDPVKGWSTRSINELSQGNSMRQGLGEGWGFTMISDPLGYTRQPAKHQWGFVRYVPKVAGIPEDSDSIAASTEPLPEKEMMRKIVAKYTPEIHDLRSFLQLMHEEGRPDAPEDAVTKLESLMEIFKETWGVVMITPERISG